MSEQTNEEIVEETPEGAAPEAPEETAGEAGAGEEPAGDAAGGGDGADEAGDGDAGEGPSEEEAQAQYDNIVLPKSNILSGPSSADLNPAF